MNHRAGVPAGTLGALALVVGALHWLVLRSSPPTLSAPPAPTPTRVSVSLLPPAARAPQPAPAREPSGAVTRAPPPVAPAAAALDKPAGPRTAGPPRPQEAAAPAAAPAPVPAPRPASTAGLPPALVPAPARWHYHVIAQTRHVQVNGNAELLWRHDGQAYEAMLRIAVAGAPQRLQASTGHLGTDGLQPLRFSARVRSEEAAHFDRASGLIVFSNNRPPAPLRPGAQDRLSVLLQLAALAAADAALLAPGTRIVLQTAGTREAEDWTFHSEGLEELALPAGVVRAHKLTRAPQHEYDLRLELWLAPGAADGPVRLRLTPPNGDWLDVQWSGTDKG